VMSLAVLGSFVPDCKDAWSYTLDTLGRFFERVQTLPPEHRDAPSTGGSLMKEAEVETPPEPLDMLGTYAESARLLGERTAALHLALANGTDHPDFEPEPFTSHYQRGLFQSMRNLTRQNFQLLSRRIKHLPDAIAADAQLILNRESDVLARFRAIYERRLTATRIRVHGDYHLGQVLYTGKDFLIIDFEGEPARSLGERRLKRSPLSDVAGMIRSFHYAAHAALLEQTERGTLPTETAGPAAAWAQYWFHWVSAIFLRAYTKSAGQASFLPQTGEERRLITDVYLLEKAVYELGYELNNRPAWLPIPIHGIRQLLD
jgi:maltose alpha-D-glucosyltransferase / alpha-amylase